MTSDTAYALTILVLKVYQLVMVKVQMIDAAGSATNADATSMKASYAYGPVTLAYSDHEYDSNTATSDQDTTSYKVSYTVSDAISISYGEEEMESEQLRC